MTRDEILALDEEELKRWVADALGWRLVSFMGSYYWITPQEVDAYKQNEVLRMGEVDTTKVPPHTRRWTTKINWILSIFWHIQAKYTACCILSSTDWGDKQVSAIASGIDSGPPAPLGIALCRLLLLLAERDKQGAASPASVEVNNG